MPRRICHLAATSVGDGGLLDENRPAEAADEGSAAATASAAVARALDGGRLIQDRTASDYANAPRLSSASFHFAIV